MNIKKENCAGQPADGQGPLGGMLPMDKITLRTDHARNVIEDVDFEELVSSIEMYGILEPVLIRDAGNDKYELVAGYRRYAACRKLGHSEILATLTEHDSHLVSLSENIERKDLTPLQQMKAIVALMASGSFRTQAQLANSINRTRDWVSKRLALKKLPDYIQNHTRDNPEPGVEVLYAISQIENPDEAIRAYDMLLKERGKKKEKVKVSGGVKPTVIERHFNKAMIYIDEFKEDREKLMAIHKKIAAFLKQIDNTTETQSIVR